MKKILFFLAVLSLTTTIFAQEQTEDAKQQADSYFNAGNTYYDQGEYDKALIELNKALKIYLANFGENHPNVANYYNNIGLVYKNQGEYDKALIELNKALKIYRNFFDELHPSIQQTKEVIEFCEQELNEQKKNK